MMMCLWKLSPQCVITLPTIRRIGCPSIAVLAYNQARSASATSNLGGVGNFRKLHLGNKRIIPIFRDMRHAVAYTGQAGGKSIGSFYSKEFMTIPGIIPELIVPELTSFQIRHYSSAAGGGKQHGFLSKLVENLRQELGKNKEMKDSIAKFREEANKLEQSEALKQARRKFDVVESEASKSSEIFKEKLETVKDKLQDAVKEASQSEFAKKASEVTGQLGKQAQNVAGSFADTGSKIANTTSFRTMSGAAAVVRDEIVEGDLGAKIYRPPVKLRKRMENINNIEEQVITPNTEAMGVELHKDSKFYQSWEKFKDSNPYVNKMLDWKIKYDESENSVIRASRTLTNKVSDIMGGLFQRTELSDTLTEIMQLDPTFDKEKFLIDCERDVIPNILEAMCRAELEILQDWCYEAAFAVLSQPLKAAKDRGLKLESRILDISQVDLAMGRVLEQGPVLVITFTAQQVSCIRDVTGKVVEGDPEKVFRVNHAWVLCRDREELNPRAAWRLLELSASASEQLL